MSKTSRHYEEKFTLNMPADEAIQRFALVNTKDMESEIVEKTDKATPFVKWAGGKRSIVNELVSRMPKEYGSYWEPFVGGGALFFELLPPKAFLSDMNFNLVLAYNAIKKDLPKLIEELRKHSVCHSEEYYYKVRERHRIQDPIERAARFIYLNRTCYNGLYRVNRKDEFNVPIGSYVNPDIVREESLIACNKALQGVSIEYKSFLDITPVKGDFAYFDPPYHPINDTSFTKYSQADFTEKEQIELAEFAMKLHKAGVKIMLSNSNTKFIRDLYKASAFTIAIVNAPRVVNCKPNGRNSVEEVLITNY
jgi:DNA adenine methylase